MLVRWRYRWRRPSTMLMRVTGDHFGRAHHQAPVLHTLDTDEAVGELLHAFATQAEKNLGTPMAGNTHMQHAQPILLSHWLLAHGEAFHRDAERLAAASARADDCPLGSGALAGCAFPLDRNALARDLGFSRTTANSLDAVSDRDFALEFLFALSTLAMHLSRLAEDFVLFASP